MQRVAFAVVGHPNKGKSSIVSTLSQNDSIAVSERSGTTIKSSGYKVETKRSGYELYDTPGFQRPSKVLIWLKKRATSADQRAKAVADFILDPECQKSFPDEVELLTPLVNGAAILYVVDGSRPYGIEYETEMEILRWTGQPSMALINPIENETHVDSWNKALTQYFKTVRVFNPMKAKFESQIELLQAFVHLRPQWAHNLQLVIDDLSAQKIIQKNNSAVILARLIEDLCFYQQKQKVLNKKQSEQIRPIIEAQYNNWMRSRELEAIKELMANYAHFQTKISLDDLTLPPELFDYEHWYMWGLNKKQLIAAATLGGATAGAIVDMAVAGHSFMIGAISGGIVGFSSALFGGDKLVNKTLKGLPLGGYEAIYGPIKNRNFPYVVIGRFIYIYSQISQRSHALRGQMDIEPVELQQQIEKLEKSNQKAIHQACDRLIKQKRVENLAKLLEEFF